MLFLESSVAQLTTSVNLDPTAGLPECHRSRSSAIQDASTTPMEPPLPCT